MWPLPVARGRAGPAALSHARSVLHAPPSSLHRALARLTRLLQGSGAEGGAEGGVAAVPLGTLTGVVLPLLQQMIVEGKAGEDAGA